jgi:KUP system potassium uptake protein
MPATERLDHAPAHGPRGGIAALTLGALGVVYGDIGTSPLYAINEVFFGRAAIARSDANVLGAISLVVWALTLVVAVKYLVLVLRADNDGEGGTFALYGLLHKFRARGLGALLFVLMLAAGLLFGEGIITPAISVLSAVEGIKIATPALEPWVVPITLAILVALFAAQRHGTTRVGRVFGPIVIVWFAAIGALGARQLALHPAALAALDPRWAFALIGRFGLRPTLVVLGGVVLAITGTEALFADLGHFGRRPIRLGFVAAVYPALVLCYLGQGALLVGGAPIAGDNVFFGLVPGGALVPMVVLATAATIIASQALISGAFSLASQAIALGLFPRMSIVHTHEHHAGQIYVPFVNAALLVGCASLVLGFQSSSALAAAYGLAVSGVMCGTTLAMTAIARLYWGWRPWRVALVFAGIAAVDVSFLAANALKFLDGGFIPLALGLALFGVMATWRWGRKATFSAYSSYKTMTVAELVELHRAQATRIVRNVVFMVPKPLRALTDNTPALLQLYWNRYGVLPANLIFVEVIHRKVPYVHRDRYQVVVFDRDPARGSVLSVTISFGFFEDPNIERVLADLARHHAIDLPADPHLWSVHVSQEHLIPSAKLSARRRAMFRVFHMLRHLSQPAYYYYGLGDEVQLSAEIVPVKLG